jgi:hypothetical protein
MVLGLALSSDNSFEVLTLCSLILVAPMLACLKLYIIIFGVSWILLRASCQTLPNSLLTNFKHCPIVVFHIFFRNIYSMFEQCKTSFLCLSSHLPIAMSPIHLFCQLPFSILFSMFWFLVNAKRRLARCRLLDILKAFLSSHIFYWVCLRLKYLIIHSKVSGATFGVNFLLPIAK